MLTFENNSVIDRLISGSIKDPETGCWIWSGTLDHGGYGEIMISGVRYRVHRASYIAFEGEIPEGIYVCHRCDTPPCINPKHFFLGTQADNMQDMMNKGRGGGRGGNHGGVGNHNSKNVGMESPRAIVSDDDVRAIRLLLGIGDLTQKEIGSRYGISRRSVYDIKVGLTWAHVQ